MPRTVWQRSIRSAKDAVDELESDIENMQDTIRVQVEELDRAHKQAEELEKAYGEIESMEAIIGELKDELKIANDRIEGLDKEEDNG